MHLFAKTSHELSKKIKAVNPVQIVSTWSCSVSFTLHCTLPLRRRVAVATPSADSSWMLLPQQETQQEETRWTDEEVNLLPGRLSLNVLSNKPVRSQESSCSESQAKILYFNVNLILFYFLLCSCWKMLTLHEFLTLSACLPDVNLQFRVFKSWRAIRNTTAVFQCKQ